MRAIHADSVANPGRPAAWHNEGNYRKSHDAPSGRSPGSLARPSCGRSPGRCKTCSSKRRLDALSVPPCRGRRQTDPSNPVPFICVESVRPVHLSRLMTFLEYAFALNISRWRSNADIQIRAPSLRDKGLYVPTFIVILPPGGSIAYTGNLEQPVRIRRLNQMSK